MPTTIEECYKILELPHTATLEEVKERYKKLALGAHPDKNINDTTNATNKFKKLVKAKEMLIAKLESTKNYESEKVNYNTLFILAVKNGNLEEVNYFLNNGADINYINEKNRDALSIAVENNNFEMVNLLLDRGADINRWYKFNRTPLIAAIGNNSLEMVNLLLDRGADINKWDRFNRTPLIAAAWCKKVEMVNLLLDRGADIINPENHSYSYSEALNIAVAYKQIEMVNLLLDRGADINKTDNLNRTPLIVAVANKDLEMVNLLNDRSTNVDQENEFNPDEINLEPNQQPSTSQQQNTLRF